MSILIAKLLRDEHGATAIEYGLIAAGISIAIVVVVGTLGSSLNTTFTSVQTALKQHLPAGASDQDDSSGVFDASWPFATYAAAPAALPKGLGSSRDIVACDTPYDQFFNARLDNEDQLLFRLPLTTIGDDLQKNRIAARRSGSDNESLSVRIGLGPMGTATGASKYQNDDGCYVTIFAGPEAERR